MKSVSMLMMLLVLVLAAGAQAGVIYSEDFEGCTDGQAVTAAPLNWINTYGSDEHVSSATNLNGLALDGDNNNDDATWYNSGMHFNHVGIASPTAATEVYTLNLKAEVFSDGGGYGSTYAAQVGFTNSSSVVLACAYYSGSRDLWYFDTRGLGGSFGDMLIYGGSNEVLEITLVVDMVNNQATLNITGASTGWNSSVTHSITPGSGLNIANVEIVQDMRPYSGGFDVDDIVVVENGYGSCWEIWNAGLGLKTDFNKDCYVNFADFAMMAEDWLRCNEPGVAGCEEPWVVPDSNGI